MEIIKRSAAGLFDLAMFHIKPADIRSYVLALGLSKLDLVVAVASVAIMELAQLLQRNEDIRDVIARYPTWGRWSLYYGLIVVIVFAGVFAQSAFIYFQF
jgi:hypothetical protein